MVSIQQKISKIITKCIFPATLTVALVCATLGICTPPALAASTAGFNPGNIITDYVMSNYSTMSVDDINNFLHSKNSCNDTNIAKASYYSSYSYHIENGHFVCMADETFNGKSAAQIIYNAAQTYRINPQVLIVLLQKEQGLVTDTWPNSVQYRSATGYGCPDTAACDTKYYGFENQVNNAAALFRSVLDGGWSNYKVGYNYIQYNPNAYCGGTTVYIQNRATASLYRYTPYQPNASALAAGYGTGDGCGAYGNRNFYLYFTDWFGSTSKQEFTDMAIPRSFKTLEGAQKINIANSATEAVVTGQTFTFSKLIYWNGELCLHPDGDSQHICIKYTNLEEIPGSEYSDMTVPRLIRVKKNTTYITTSEPNQNQTVPKNTIIRATQRATVNGQLCLRAEDIVGQGLNQCIPYNALTEITTDYYSAMTVARSFIATANSEIIDSTTGSVVGKLDDAHIYNFNQKATYDDKLCLKGVDFALNTCVLYDNLKELNSSTYAYMVVPRKLQFTKDTYKINSSNGNEISNIEKNTIADFDALIYLNNKLYLRLSEDTTAGHAYCVPYDSLKEL